MNAQDVFIEEVTKSAETARALARAARWLTESPARTALVGAGVGAAHGALTHGDEGLVGATLRGGLQGAAVGGAAGGLGRAYRDTRLLNPALSAGGAVGATAKRLGEGVKRFGQRQLHGFTGAYAGREAEIGLRSTGEAARRQKLEKLRSADRMSRMTGLADKVKETEGLVNRGKELASWGRQGDEAIRAGITSLPGVAKGLATKPLATAKALGKETMAGGGAAMAVGLPVALSAPDLIHGDESAEGGRSMRQKVVNLGSGLVGGALTAGVPVIPQLVGGLGVDATANATLGRRRRLARAQGGT